MNNQQEKTNLARTGFLLLLGLALLVPSAAQAYINCYSYGPGGILLGPCENGYNGIVPSCSVVGYANDPISQGNTPDLQARLMDLGSGDYDAVTITLPEGSNREAYPTGAPTKGSASTTLQALFRAADEVGDGLKKGEHPSTDGVLLVFERGILDQFPAGEPIPIEELLGLADSARSITGYYAHR
ncbi:MAG: hypothetical protein K0U98_04795 [Deltaproteobacteria bacterium]|nr:hypothetical protein [Deltaproteobacteria bacterium]